MYVLNFVACNSFDFSNQAISPTKQKNSNLLSRVDLISNHIDYGILQGYFLSEPIVVFVRSSKYSAKSLSVTIFDRLILFVDSDLAKWFGDLTKTIISSDKKTRL